MTDEKTAKKEAKFAAKERKREQRKERREAFMKKVESSAFFPGHTVKNGVYKYVPTGAFHSVSKPIAGAVATFESGATNTKTTLGRVVAGGIIAGPAGAIVGGMMKKDKSKVYATVTFADGDYTLITAPATQQSALMEFVARVNKIASA